MTVQISPRFLEENNYKIKIRTHIIDNFKKDGVFHNNFGVKKKADPHWVHIPPFQIDRAGNALPYGKTGDHSILVSEVFDIVELDLRSVAESSYNLNNRNEVTVNLVIESPDGIHVTQVGMASPADDTPLFNNSNTFFRT